MKSIFLRKFRRRAQEAALHRALFRISWAACAATCVSMLAPYQPQKFLKRPATLWFFGCRFERLNVIRNDFIEFALLVFRATPDSALSCRSRYPKNAVVPHLYSYLLSYSIVATSGKVCRQIVMSFCVSARKDLVAASELPLHLLTGCDSFKTFEELNPCNFETAFL
jgi:hypothetical protein